MNRAGTAGRDGARALATLAALAAPVALAVFTALALPVHLAAQAPPVDVTEVLRSLGQVDGPPGRVFDRVASVDPLPGGRILVGDGGSYQIRVYGERPDPVWTFGSEGQGPGEFLSLDGVAPYRGDSLVAWDARQARLTVVSSAGELGRTIALGSGRGVGAIDPRASSSARLDVVGPLDDGSFVARRGDIHVGPGDTTAVRRDRFTYVLLGTDGAVLRDLVTLPDDEQFVWANERSRSVRPRAYGRVTSTETEGSAFGWAANDGFRATILDVATGAERRFETPRERRPVGEAERRRWLDQNAASTDLPPAFRAQTEAALRAMPFPDHLPWHGRLVLAEGGDVWLEEYRTDVTAPAVWTVFPAASSSGSAAPAGEPRRRRFPTGFRLTAVADGRAYGVSVGEFDVQRVTVLELPGGGR